MRGYFDNAATTKLDDKVFEAMLPYLKDSYGNASAIYGLGQEAKIAIEDARNKVAKVLNCDAHEIYFTSGGSESDNTVIKGIARANKVKGNHIITSKIEHPAVLETCKELEKEGFEISYISVDKDGLINLDELKKEIKSNTILISIMFANNEIGTIQPIKEIGKIAKENNIFFHTDAVQAIGNVRINVKELGIDALSLSAHKFYGPKGVGAFYLKSGINFNKFIDGGHQERDRRAGTENVAGIVGLGKAIELAYDNFDEVNQKIKELRDYYEECVKEKISYIKINGSLENRLFGNSNISFRYIEGDSLIINLDLEGLCASSGSACTSGSIDPSHVLMAIDLDKDLVRSSLRVTIGKNNTKDEIDYLIDNLVKIVNRLRKKSDQFVLEENKDE